MNKIAKDYITEENGQFSVHSESGKRMGTYPSREAAEARLKQIEYFKHAADAVDMEAGEFDALKDLLGKFFTEEEQEPEHQAADSIAMDKDTVRTMDDAGRMHVASAHISKACVSPYIGREIPGWESLGLAPDKIYHLLRDPTELKKAASTFNNMQILVRHVPVSATDPQIEDVVGATGSNATFNDPWLDNDLVIWTKSGIDLIESGAQRSLSCGYAYDAVLENGTFEGEPYSIKMVNIKGNHLALVEKGRVDGAIIGDAAIELSTKEESQFQQEKTMTKHVLTRKAAVAQGAVLAHLRPLLAADAAINFGAIFAPITAKNFKDKRQSIVDALKPSLKLKSGTAMDAALKAIAMGLDDADGMETEEGADTDPNSGLPMSAEEMRDKAADDNPLMAELASVLSPELMAKVKECMGGKEAMDEDKREDGESDPDYLKRIRAKDAAKAKDAANPEAGKPAVVTKEAMDSQISAGVTAAVTAERQRSKDAAEARQFVEPWVGKVSLAHDSAETIYRTTLGMLGVQHEAVKDGAALKILVQAQPKPNTHRPHVALAADAAPEGKSFTDMFPGADRIGHAA